MKYKPFYYRDKVWDKLCCGIDRVFTLSLYRNGVCIDICHFGTILKKASYGLVGWHFTKIIY